ncbi:hypothetical protein B0H13DRAFT_1916823 [Mycena leptocephala]|nr:hypothetical protein B0H13DRAFT_1916823 [Mycena leptocephala]
MDTGRRRSVLFLFLFLLMPSVQRRAHEQEEELEPDDRGEERVLGACRGGEGACGAEEEGEAVEELEETREEAPAHAVGRGGGQAASGNAGTELVLLFFSSRRIRSSPAYKTELLFLAYVAGVVFGVVIGFCVSLSTVVVVVCLPASFPFRRQSQSHDGLRG